MQIIVAFRQYNGKYSNGSIFAKQYTFEAEGPGELATVMYSMRYCADKSAATVKEKDATFNIGRTFVMDEDAWNRLQEISEEFASSEKYQMNYGGRYKAHSFDPRRFGYCDVIIDGKHYEIKDDALIGVELMELIESELLLQALETCPLVFGNE